MLVDGIQEGQERLALTSMGEQGREGKRRELMAHSDTYVPHPVPWSLVISRHRF